MKLLRSIDRCIARWEGRLIVVFLSLMILLSFLQVLLRTLATHAGIAWADTLLGHTSWTDIFVRVLMLWLAFLGASLLTREDGHIRIDAVATVLPERLKPYREAILSLAAAWISGILCVASVRVVLMEMEFGGDLFLGVPTWIGQGILPAGFLMIAFRFLIRGLEQALRTERTS